LFTLLILLVIFDTDAAILPRRRRHTIYAFRYAAAFMPLPLIRYARYFRWPFFAMAAH